MERFHLGKRTKVFELIQYLLGDVAANRQKSLLSLFILSCMEPFVLLPGFSRQTSPSCRPGKVLFETVSDSGDPQVRTFLSMMGCGSGSVEVANPRMMNCYARPCPKLKRKA
jgi:hypothetical protein